MQYQKARVLIAKEDIPYAARGKFLWVEAKPPEMRTAGLLEGFTLVGELESFSYTSNIFMDNAYLVVSQEDIELYPEFAEDVDEVDYTLWFMRKYTPEEHALLSR